MAKFTSLRDKLIKNSSIKMTSVMTESKLFEEKDSVMTSVPAINVALSGSIYGGMTPGILQIAGDSKHFKSSFMLLMASAYLKAHDDAVILFYDSEFGSPKSYVESFDIDPERIVHTPITNIEQLKFDVMKQIDALERNDKVIILVDSIGNLASKKEVDDALNENAAQDMSRPKQLKSLFRMVTPHLTIKNIPMVIINHVYDTLELYSKKVVGGGKGSYLSSDNIWIITRRQNKEQEKGEKTKTLKGFDFTINVEKSRYVKEGSQIPVTVSFEKGILKWSGLFDLAMELGFISQVKSGWYAVVDPATGEFNEGDKLQRRGDLEYNSEFWRGFFLTSSFDEALKERFLLAQRQMITDDETVADEEMPLEDEAA